MNRKIVLRLVSQQRQPFKRRRHINGEAIKRRSHQTGEAHSNGVSHSNGEAIETQKRRQPFKRRRHINGEAIKRAKPTQTASATQTAKPLKHRNGVSHSNGEAIETQKRASATELFS